MDLKRIDAAIASYAKSDDKNLAGRLEFFRGIWEIQNQYAHTAADYFCCPSAEDLLQWYWDGEVFLQRAPYAIQAHVLEQAANDTALYFVEHGVFDDNVNDTLRQMDWTLCTKESLLSLAGTKPGQFLEDTLDTVLRCPDIMRADFIIMVLSLALRAVLDPVAQQMMDSIGAEVMKHCADHDKHSYCPVCGGEPTIAVIGKTDSHTGNSRTLWCSQCGTSWETERLGCTHCHTHTQEHLHYTHINDDDAHRLYHCDECKGFLRTTFNIVEGNTFNDKVISFEVEDVVMAPLNQVAESILN